MKDKPTSVLEQAVYTYFILRNMLRDKTYTKSHKVRVLYWWVFRPLKWKSWIIRLNQGCSLLFAYDRTKYASRKEIKAFLKMNEK